MTMDVGCDPLIEIEHSGPCSSIKIKITFYRRSQRILLGQFLSFFIRGANIAGQIKNECHKPDIFRDTILAEND
jgi:hypothetical protein